ncbi:hypothetical protein [Crateriforma conspicua]|uniref:hypothetical protein n=1 Tax=Crateriforma conspicua TaxID=2527996 RepID=UPI0011899B09|nr:hypothetical protein [Crateriforma conspicua]QDV63294.1 hypothetical protein Mal65_24360 [Crateriforma conspicua]
MSRSSSNTTRNLLAASTMRRGLGWATATSAKALDRLGMRTVWTQRQRRRWVSLASTVLIALVYAAFHREVVASLGDARWLSGFTLAACLGVLVMIGMRRRIPVLPLGSVSTWTQVHIYTGLFAALVYVTHVPVLVGDGWLEGTLSVAFLATSLSGFYGLYASRTVPRRISRVGEEIRFDQYGWHRSQLHDAATRVISELGDGDAARIVKRIFDDKVQPYLARPLCLSQRLYPTPRIRQKLLADLNHQRRYLDEASALAVDQMMGLVRRRDQVDFQYALQWRLRIWVAAHATLSIVLVVLATVHVVIAIGITG